MNESKKKKIAAAKKQGRAFIPDAEYKAIRRRGAVQKALKQALGNISFR